jgi:hypothetical protein
MIPKSGHRFSEEIMLQQLCHTAVTHFDDPDGSYAANWGAAMSNDANSRFHRINGEMLETIDEELELEIDDDRLAKLLGEVAEHRQEEALERHVYFKDV